MPNFSKWTPEQIANYRRSMKGINSKSRPSLAMSNGSAVKNPMAAVKFRLAAIDLSMKQLETERIGILDEVRALLSPQSLDSLGT